MSRFTYKSLDSTNSSVTKYTAHKSWTITDETAPSYGVVSLSGSYSSGSLNIGDPLDTSAAVELKTNGIHQRLLFDSIHHLYYTNPDNAHLSGDNEFLGKQHRELLSDIQVLSIPSNIYGSRIVPGSVYLDAGNIDFWDDGNGNLVSTRYLPKNTRAQLSHRWPPNPDSTFIHISFDGERSNPVGDKFPNNFVLKSKGENVNIYPTCQNTVSGLGRKVGTFYTYHPLTYRAAELSGTASISSGSESVIEIQNTTGIANWNSDFAISCWVKIPTSQSVSSSFTGPLLPGTQRTLESHTENIIATSRGFIDTPSHNSIIPWEISVVNDGIGTDAVGKIYARRGQYDDVTLLTSSLSHNITGSGDVWTHILFQKTGSNLQLLVNSGSTNWPAVPGVNAWVVGTNTGSAAMVTGSDPLANIDIVSHANICIGAQRAGYKQIRAGSKDAGTPPVTHNPAYIKPLSASIDEFTIYNQALNGSTKTTDAAGRPGPIESIHVHGASHPYVGNVFYNHGIITVTDNYSTEDATLAVNDYTLTFSGSHDITAHSYKCTVEDGEYNMTLNPSARQGYSMTNPNLQGFVTGSEFTPYITTIGLYDDNNELLGIGKLAQPVKSPKDFDITFVVRFDT
jgi:hypothetical protein